MTKNNQDTTLHLLHQLAVALRQARCAFTIAFHSGTVPGYVTRDINDALESYDRFNHQPDPPQTPASVPGPGRPSHET